VLDAISNKTELPVPVFEDSKFAAMVEFVEI
jgi:hypothetical protein